MLPAFLHRWLSQFSIARRLYLITALFVPVIVALAVSTVLSIGVLWGLRAYVAGEGLYSKYQKDASFYLSRYLNTGNGEHYEQFEASLQVPLADGRARREMEKTDYDYDEAARHFEQALNDPADIPLLIFLFRYARGLPYMETAVDLWRQGDLLIGDLRRLGEDVHERMEEAPLGESERFGVAARVEALNRELITLENEFSRTIGEGFRWASLVLVGSVLALGTLLLAGSLVASGAISRGISREVDTLTRGVERIAAGDLSTRVGLDSGDELARLGDWVNRMAANIEEAERDLRGALSVLSATLESTADGLLVIDEDWQIVTYNQRFAEIWGIPESLLREKDSDRIMEKVLANLKDPEGFRARVEEVHGSPESESYDLIEFVDGRTIERVSRPQHVEGRSVGRVWSFRDVTLRKRAEETLVRAREAAEAANEAKSRFLANVSHEIRTPLNTVIGMADLLAETPLSEQQQAYVHSLNRAGDLLLRLIQQVLDLSKVEAGKLEIESISVEVRAVVEDTCAMLESGAHRKGLELRRQVADDVPRYIVGDPSRLQQVLTNLIGNAIKFTGKGHVTVDVKCREAAAGPVLRFRVRDTGIGIPRDRMDDVFESFTQMDSSFTRQYGGTGLGLTITRHLVELMGGKIWVDSTPGLGSTFSFTLPVVPSGEETSARSVSAQAIAGEPVGQDPVVEESRDILLVEDSQDNVTLMRLYLRTTAYRLTVANDGEQAVRLAERRSFDMILMDVQMPVMDGITATREIRAIERRVDRARTPILALTAHALKEDQERCLQAGCDGFLTKPVRKGDLLSAIRTHLQEPTAAMVAQGR